MGGPSLRFSLTKKRAASHPSLDLTRVFLREELGDFILFTGENLRL